jgi:hypothetical protein
LCCDSIAKASELGIYGGDVSSFRLKWHAGSGISAGISKFSLEPFSVFLLYNLQDAETANFGLKNPKDET